LILEKSTISCDSILFHCVKSTFNQTYTVTFILFHLVLRNWSRQKLHHLRRVGLGLGQVKLGSGYG
jgi:hypothetical protein